MVRWPTNSSCSSGAPATRRSTDFAEQLREATGPLAAAGTPVAQLNLADRHVDAAAPLRQVALDPQPVALVRIANDRPATAYRPVEALLTGLAAVDRVAAYAVQTREPLTDDSPGSGPGVRTPGWSQLALLRRAPGLDVEAFRERWLDHHTTVAIETQSTFRYVQHLVEQRLGADAPPLDGLVEECFPTEAMTDPHAFFATGGDAELLGERINAMVDSVQSFLDLDVLDVIPTSEYRFDR